MEIDREIYIGAFMGPHWTQVIRSEMVRVRRRGTTCVYIYNNILQLGEVVLMYMYCVIQIVLYSTYETE